MLQTRFWAEMTWTDFEARDMARAIAVLPLAATEQHDPHLPLGTDSFIMEGHIAKVVARLPDELPVLFLPVQNCGHSIEHTNFPGTLSVPAEPLISAWTLLGWVQRFCYACLWFCSLPGATLCRGPGKTSGRRPAYCYLSVFLTAARLG